MKRDWFKLVDELKDKSGLTSDAQLASYLGVTRAHISAWRNGKSDLGAITKLRVLDALGHDDLRSAVVSLLSDADALDGPTQHKALISKVSAARSPAKRKTTVDT